MCHVMKRNKNSDTQHKLPHFQPIFLKLKTKKDIRDTTDPCKIWLILVCENSELWLTRQIEMSQFFRHRPYPILSLH